MRGVLCAFVIVFSVVHNEEVPLQGSIGISEQTAVLQSKKKLSQTIMEILEHYKQPDPVGIPGAPIPEPMDIPNMKHSLSIGRMEFKKVKLYGLPKFRIEHVIVDLAAMKAEASLSINKLNVKGNYTLSTWLSRAQGPFTVNLTQVNVFAVARLEVERNGSLEAQEIDMDIKFQEIAMDFQGLGFFANMFQGMMNSVGTLVFDSIKPFVLAEANTNIRNDVNKEIRKFPKTFPNSISPFDDLICEVRKKVRSMGLDPYKVADYNSTAGIFEVYLTHTWLYGAASFHRTDDIKIEMKNKTVNAYLEVGTGLLKGTSNWEVCLVGGFLSNLGTISFTVNYIKTTVNISQSLDTSIPPKLEDIQIEVGNMQIRFDGLGTIDYLVELGINVFPNLIRYQIVDALEKPIRIRIQEALNQLNVENLIKENSEKLDNLNALEEFKNL